MAFLKMKFGLPNAMDISKWSRRNIGAISDVTLGTCCGFTAKITTSFSLATLNEAFLQYNLNKILLKNLGYYHGLY
jgi:hypothetical protein